MVELLLRLGASIDAVQGPLKNVFGDIDFDDLNLKTGCTALHIAIALLHYDIVDTLLSSGADTEARSGYLFQNNAGTALHLAIRREDAPLVRFAGFQGGRSERGDTKKRVHSSTARRA